MKKTTNAIIAGGVIGMLGLSMAMNDRSVRKRVMRDTKKIAKKASNIIDNFS
jgi:hypothetical protein